MTDPPLPVSEKLPWWKAPLLLSAAVAVGLVAAGDRYPLTPFPMYSRIDPSADMLMIRNEKDEILPMSRLFNVGSAQGKKRFETALNGVADTKEYEKATPEQRAEAGRIFLTKLWEGRDKGDVAKLPQPPQAIRAVIRTVSMKGTEFRDHEVLIAELRVTGGDAASTAPAEAPARAEEGGAR